jgi:uncharacterized membrane protein
MEISWILILLGVVISVTSLLGAVGILRPNGLIGIRTAATRRSEAAWKAGHARAALIMVPTGLVLITYGIGLAREWTFFSSLGDAAPVVGLVIAIAATLVAGKLSTEAARSA